MLYESTFFRERHLNAMVQHPNYGSKRLLALAEEEMPVHVNKLGFVCY